MIEMGTKTRRGGREIEVPSNASTSPSPHHHVSRRGCLHRAASFAKGQETSRKIWFGCVPPVAFLTLWRLSVLDPLDNTKKRKRAEESDSDTPESASDSDGQDVQSEEEEEPRKAKPKRKAASTTKPKPKAAKSKAPPQKKPRIPKTTSAKLGPKATKRTRKPKGGDTMEPFDAEKLAKDTHISGDNPLFSMWRFFQPGWH